MEWKVSSRATGFEKQNSFLLTIDLNYTDTKGNAFFLAPALVSVIKLVLARNGILLNGRTNYHTPARHSPRSL
jgi:hypothetical protein